MCKNEIGIKKNKNKKQQIITYCYLLNKKNDFKNSLMFFNNNS